MGYERRQISGVEDLLMEWDLGRLRLVFWGRIVVLSEFDSFVFVFDGEL